MQNFNAISSTSYADDIGLRYHAQSDTTYCGAAVAQMILRPFENVLEEQDFLAVENSLHNPPGQVNGVCVEGLVLTLNQYVRRTFTSAQPTDPLSAAAAELIRTGSGVAALVNGGRHWVALNGVVIVPRNESHSGFYVHDPHATSLPNAHQDQDDCGSGGASGIANQFFTFPGMRRYCDPVALVYSIEPHPTAPAVPVRPVAAPMKTWSGSGLSSSASGPASFDPLTVTASAIAATGIAERGPLAAILTGFQPAASALVDDYCHVTLRRGKQTIGYAALAPDDGTLLAVMVSGNEWPLMDLSEQSVRNDLDANRAKIERVAPGFLYELDSQHAAIEASFFWCLCREAPSPSHPLVRISAGPHVLYRDHYGDYHARLHILDS